ncbi:response regulator [Rubrimonas cliftonensis]|uniref:Response regulator receiver domain-containing protein n=1 Tax=Rubrimonas cliftonensis TaxID=89524 RepID=A0A1H3X8R5_9RHOB|nr:response regulator [Rubrimonas cliftonensis]SDZ95044.1 Response regulator receiver domain-containing protein [Rubrimonas cliftonensis]
MKIMVVEDDALLAEHVCQLLREAGFEPVGPFATAASALEEARRLDAAGAVIDYDLGSEASGAEVARLLCALDLPVLFVTGVPRATIPTELRACSFLAKPFSEQDFERMALAVFTARS